MKIIQMNNDSIKIKNMKDTLKVIALLLGVIVVVGILGFMIQGADFFMFKFWAPKYENTRREVFEQSKAYNEGMAQELSQMMIEYKRAKSQNERDAIRATVVHRAANFNLDNSYVNPDLKDFIRQMQAGN